jgi:hypothetical protein
MESKIMAEGGHSKFFCVRITNISERSERRG